MIPSGASEAERLAHVLSHTEARVTRELEKALAQENCTVEQWRALTLLADGGPHTMSEIAVVCTGVGVLADAPGRPARG